MIARRSPRVAIFLPWESRVGLRRLLRIGRARLVLGVLLTLAFVLLVGARERRQSGVRQTRALLLDARGALDSYLAENDGACPPSLQSVFGAALGKELPSDAWGNPLRLVCPARREGERYELSSDGPDGKPGGLDRIE